MSTQPPSPRKCGPAHAHPWLPVLPPGQERTPSEGPRTGTIECRSAPPRVRSSACLTPLAERSVVDVARVRPDVLQLGSRYCPCTSEAYPLRRIRTVEIACWTEPPGVRRLLPLARTILSRPSFEPACLRSSTTGPRSVATHPAAFWSTYSVGHRGLPPSTAPRNGRELCLRRS